MAATSEEIKRSLIHKILIGQYPVGATLPSCRDLAAELGINRNTASKIYQELAREGLVKAVRGRGVLVINQRGAGKATVPSVREHAFAAAREAKLLGLGREAFLQAVTEVADVLYQRQRPAIAFVECNQPDARALAHEIASEIQFLVQPVLLADLQANPAKVASEYDCICTTLYHLKPTTQALEPLGVPVVALHAPPDPDALLEIARLDPETRVGIVCSQETTLKYLATAVAMVHRGPVRTSLASDREALESLAQYADVLIDSPSCHRDVSRFFSSLPIVTVGFRIDVKSLGPLRDRLAQLISAQSIDPSTCAVDSQAEE
ncbi:MAG: GntR family transcriptional regulator [Anaerolineae bacterium]